mmetsp:Transcript_150659/g.262472  ORF Transcript_150659/g.262472 Transcript_150659/m.262472 type:complete len:258 (+) Transcript_150659:2173-2946(+)
MPRTFTKPKSLSRKSSTRAVLDTQLMGFQQQAKPQALKFSARLMANLQQLCRASRCCVSACHHQPMPPCHQPTKRILRTPRVQNSSVSQATNCKMVRLSSWCLARRMVRSRHRQTAATLTIVRLLMSSAARKVMVTAWIMIHHQKATILTITIVFVTQVSNRLSRTSLVCKSDIVRTLMIALQMLAILGGVETLSWTTHAFAPSDFGSTTAPAMASHMRANHRSVETRRLWHMLLRIRVECKFTRMLCSTPVRRATH